jgi:hypothetical protein
MSTKKTTQFMVIELLCSYLLFMIVFIKLICCEKANAPIEQWLNKDIIISR